MESFLFIIPASDNDVVIAPTGIENRPKESHGTKCRKGRLPPVYWFIMVTVKSFPGTCQIHIAYNPKLF